MQVDVPQCLSCLLWCAGGADVNRLNKLIREDSEVVGAELDSLAALWETRDNISRPFRGSTHEYKEQ